jgi:hypothetical protein
VVLEQFEARRSLGSIHRDLSRQECRYYQQDKAHEPLPPVPRTFPGPTAVQVSDRRREFAAPASKAGTM